MRRKVGIGGTEQRRREVVKPMVPKVTDEDIEELCRRYPIKVNDEGNESEAALKGASLRMQNLRVDAKRQQLEISANVRAELAKSKKDLFEFKFDTKRPTKHTRIPEPESCTVKRPFNIAKRKAGVDWLRLVIGVIFYADIDNLRRLGGRNG